MQHDESGALTIRERLIDIALIEFGQHGLDGVGTRELAKKADTVMSSITYYFGGKHGLYIAVARHVAKTLALHMADAMNKNIDFDKLSSGQAVEELCKIFANSLKFVLSPQSSAMAQFIIREQMYPSEAFNIIYINFIGLIGNRLGNLIIKASCGRITVEEARIRALTLFGQCLIFRVAHATLLKLTEWDNIDAQKEALIYRVIEENIKNILK